MPPEDEKTSGAVPTISHTETRLDRIEGRIQTAFMEHEGRLEESLAILERALDEVMCSITGEFRSQSDDLVDEVVDEFQTSLKQFVPSACRVIKTLIAERSDKGSSHRCSNCGALGRRLRNHSEYCLECEPSEDVMN